MASTVAWRALWALVCGLRVGAGVGAAGQAPPTPRWVYGITRVAYTDLPNSLRYGDWPDKVIADFARAGVQMMFSRVHNGSDSPGLAWRSAFGDPDPAMQGRDGTREVVALCHRNHIRYMAYYWAQREAAAVTAAHPDWQMRDSAGSPNGYLCGNTAYRDLVRSRLVELVRDVGVDGIFFDMYHVVGDACYCPACKAKFRALTGQDPPVREDFDSLLWQQWTEFRCRSIEEALLDYNRAIKAVNPDAALMVNSWNAWVYRNPGNLRSSISVAECVDGLLEETGWYDTVDPSFFAFPAHMAFMNWHLAGLCKEKRAFMWGAPSLPGWLPLAYEEPAVRVMTMMANGAVPAHSVPGRDAMARYMADVADREEYTRGARLFPWCGLVMSEKTERWYGRDDPKERYVKGIYGAFQAMLERHLPAVLVTDRELERGLLERYRVLFLPNCAAMSAAEMETVRRYVREGGSLVATFETSLYDEHGRPRPDFGLGDVLHARRIGVLDARQMPAAAAGPSATLTFAAEHPWSADPVIRRTLNVRDVAQPVTDLSRDVPLHSRVLLVSPAGVQRSALRLRTAAHEPRSGLAEARNTVGLIQSTYGKGRVYYLPFDASWSFYRYGHEYLARMLELALREAASEPPPVEVAAPTIVEAMPQVQPGRLVVHLLNDISSLGRGQNFAGEALYVRREVVPIYGITVTFRSPAYDRYLLVPGGKLLPALVTPAGRRVTVPRLDVHCMVVAERSGAGRPPSPVRRTLSPTSGRTAPVRPAGPAVQPGADLLRDGRFAERAGAALAHWHLAQPPEGSVTMSAESDMPSGAGAMHLAGASGWACGESERIAVKPGRRYVLRGQARATVGDVFLQVSYWRGSQWLGLTQSSGVTTDGVWQECTAGTELGRFPGATEVSISGTGRGGRIDAWFRDLSFREAPAR